MQALEEATKKLDDAVMDVENSILTPPVEKPKILCKNNCGYWGDFQLDGLCSQCHRKKYVDQVHRSPAIRPNASPALVAAAPAAKKREKCTKDCGFFENPGCDGMCSKCFVANGGDLKSIDPLLNKKKNWRQKLHSAKIKLHAHYLFVQGKRPAQEHKDRCWKCQRKLGLSGIECRCHYIFCGKHRYRTNMTATLTISSDSGRRWPRRIKL